MKVNLYHCIFVLEESENENKRKNDISKLKIVVNSKTKECPIIELLDTTDIKEIVRNSLKKVIGYAEAHTEQVYTLAEKKYSYDGAVTIIYMTVTNQESIELAQNYEAIDFDIENQASIVWGKQNYSYQTKQKKIGNHFEYIHEIDCPSIELEKTLLCSLISYKYLKNRLDYTDVLFHFFPQLFTLEQVRILYEKIKETKVDKSNFRKRIMKYCEETDKVMDFKGYRPAKYFKFKVRKDDIWL